MSTPDLHTALQREREAAEPNTTDLAVCLRAERDAWWATRGEYDDPFVRERQHATDQALAALETRPTLAEVEAAVREAVLREQERAETPSHCRAIDETAEAIRDALRTLYGRGGVE